MYLSEVPAMVQGHREFQRARAFDTMLGLVATVLEDPRVIQNLGEPLAQDLSELASQAFLPTVDAVTQEVDVSPLHEGVPVLPLFADELHGKLQWTPAAFLPEARRLNTVSQHSKSIDVHKAAIVWAHIFASNPENRISQPVTAGGCTFSLFPDEALDRQFGSFMPTRPLVTFDARLLKLPLWAPASMGIHELMHVYIERSRVERPANILQMLADDEAKCYFAGAAVVKGLHISAESIRHAKYTTAMRADEIRRANCDPMHPLQATPAIIEGYQALGVI